MATKIFCYSEEELQEMMESVAEKTANKVLEMFVAEKKLRPMDAEADRNLPIMDLCSRWNVSKGTVHNYVKQGLISPLKLGRRVLFPMSEVLRAEANGLTKFRGGLQNEK